MGLEQFSAPVRAWFDTSFPAPTPAQAQGWPAIAAGDHTLILAPTGSGKTLAAFLWGIDRLATEPVPDKERRTRLLYISPLRALAVDIEKNLRAPLAGIRLAGERLGIEVNEPVVGMRTGDTSTDERRRLVRHPPDLLITTPESLYLMLTSQARETLRGVQAVIIDEIHAVAATKRGSHLALTLERLAAVCDQPPQRIGLSATQRPLEEIARFLGGFGEDRRPRPVTIVDAGVRKEMDVEVVVPVDDMGDLGTVSAPGELRSGPAHMALTPQRASIWTSIYPRILEQVLEHRTTIIFCNARRQAER
ncbi:MAG: ATP-dependent helicase Lhr and Lhr-like helicase, partial [Acidimicrobiaceae bacterium]